MIQLYFLNCPHSIIYHLIQISMEKIVIIALFKSYQDAIQILIKKGAFKLRTLLKGHNV